MDIRPSPIAGRWYPGSAGALRELIEGYFAQVKVLLPAGKAWGVVAPHAGFVYSGPVAAYAFQAVAALRPDLVVVISPYHRAHHAPLLTTAHAAYQTPLGEVPVAQDVLRSVDGTLRERLDVGLTHIRCDQEHAVEIELPFLQHLFGEFELLPLMMVDQGVKAAQALGEVLADCVAGRDVLFVASSDLSHFYTQEKAAVFDQTILKRIEAFHPAAVIQAEREGVGFACGRGAIAATLWAAQKLGANQANILHYATSGDVSGDMESVVGYGAAVILQEEAEA